MWYTLAPAISLTCFFGALPVMINPAVHYLLRGVPYVRQNCEDQEMEHWRRDAQLSYKKNGDGHRTVYFEGLPDRK